MNAGRLARGFALLAPLLLFPGPAARAQTEEWTGARTLALVPFEKNFDIGALEPGTYTLDFKSWGTTLKQLQFTVIQTPPAAQPADQTCFFVSQHYRDFLSREPDGSGLAFWTDGLNRCGLDAQCREVL